MNSDIDLKKHAILYVDDLTESLELFSANYGDEFRIFTAKDAAEGLEVLGQHLDEIGILITDQRMPGQKGTWLLEQARKLKPQILRILVTANNDMEVAVQAVNTGAIYKYVSKPWNPLELEQTLRRGLEFFAVQSERNQLLREKESLMRERMLASRVVSLGLVSAGLNHHIKNRLQSIQTFLECVEQGLSDMEFLKKSRLAADEILGLLDDLQLASADQSRHAPLTAVHLKDAVTSLIPTPAGGSIRLHLENEIPASLPALHTELARLRRVLELLFKYEQAVLPAGSRLRLSAETCALNQRPAIALKLADNGPVMNLETLKLAMDPLVLRGQPAEYDIYLMVCLFIVRQLGGNIEVGGGPGGNHFIIRLPLEHVPGPSAVEETQFLQRVFRNEQLWEKFNSE